MSSQPYIVSSQLSSQRFCTTSCGPSFQPSYDRSSFRSVRSVMSYKSSYDPPFQSSYDLQLQKSVSPAVVVHFLDKYRTYIIRKIADVDSVVSDLLEQEVITREQHERVLCKFSNQQKMEELYLCIGYQGNGEKDKVRDVLRNHNYPIIRDMELAIKHLPLGFQPLSPAIENFLTHHKMDLVDCITMVDPVLDDLLDKCVLEIKQYDNIKENASPGEKMKAILDMASRWGDYSKFVLYESLCKYNNAVIKEFEKCDTNKDNRKSFEKVPQQTFMKITAQELATGYLDTSPSFFQLKTDRLPNSYYYNENLQNERIHFIDRHCWDLIRVILLVDPVLDDIFDEKMLTQEQYEHIMKMTTPKKKMIELSEISNKWWHTEKDKLYLSLRDHNYHFIRLMEISDGKSIGISRNHFLDRHQSALKRTITVVNAVVEDLLAQKLVTQDQYNLMLRKETCEEKMAILYEISSSWDDSKKDKLYLSIRKENYSVIRDLEVKFKAKTTETSETSSAVSSVERNKGMRIANYARYAITCSICIDIYTNPVTLSCGHSYCMNCINKTWNEQFEGECTCPQCRLRFKKRPDLKKNLDLSEIAECCRLSQSDSKADKSDCTYCTDANMPAVKRCVLCKSFLCDDHLSMHCSPSDYALLEPTEPLEARKCSIHEKILEYFCIDDSCLICVSCCIGEDHQGHCIETLNEAAEKKKEKLRSFQEQLNLHMPATWNKIQDLNDWKREMEKNQTQDVMLTGNVKQIVQESGLLGNNSMLKKEDFASVSTLLEKMETKYNEMSSKVDHIEKVCHMMDPFMVLNDTESKTADFYNAD